MSSSLSKSYRWQHYFVGGLVEEVELVQRYPTRYNPNVLFVLPTLPVPLVSIDLSIDESDHLHFRPLRGFGLLFESGCVHLGIDSHSYALSYWKDKGRLELFLPNGMDDLLGWTIGEWTTALVEVFELGGEPWKWNLVVNAKGPQPYEGDTFLCGPGGFCIEWTIEWLKFRLGEGWDLPSVEAFRRFNLKVTDPDAEKWQRTRQFIEEAAAITSRKGEKLLQHLHIPVRERGEFLTPEESVRIGYWYEEQLDPIFETYTRLSTLSRSQVQSLFDSDLRRRRIARLKMVDWFTAYVIDYDAIDEDGRIDPSSLAILRNAGKRRLFDIQTTVIPDPSELRRTLRERKLPFVETIDRLGVRPLPPPVIRKIARLVQVKTDSPESEGFGHFIEANIVLLRRFELIDILLRHPTHDLPRLLIEIVENQDAQMLIEFSKHGIRLNYGLLTRFELKRIGKRSSGDEIPGSIVPVMLESGYPDHLFPKSLQPAIQKLQDSDCSMRELMTEWSIPFRLTEVAAAGNIQGCDRLFSTSTPETIARAAFAAIHFERRNVIRFFMTKGWRPTVENLEAAMETRSFTMVYELLEYLPLRKEWPRIRNEWRYPKGGKMIIWRNVMEKAFKSVK